MKRTALVLGIALTLSGSTANVRAGGCCGFWPFWPVAFGTIAIASIAAAHSSPTYVYVPQPYPYGYAYPQPQHPVNPAPSPQTPPPATSSPTTSTFEQASHWVPSSPGTGHWVPDSAPYSYDPGAQTKVIASTTHPAATQLVTPNRSGGRCSSLHGHAVGEVHSTGLTSVLFQEQILPQRAKSTLRWIAPSKLKRARTNQIPDS